VNETRTETIARTRKRGLIGCRFGHWPRATWTWMICRGWVGCQVCVHDLLEECLAVVLKVERGRRRCPGAAEVRRLVR